MWDHIYRNYAGSRKEKGLAATGINNKKIGILKEICHGEG
jgi:hypothetical protein